MDRFADRRMSGEDDIHDQDDHDDAENLYENIHRLARFFDEEDRDRDRGADHRSKFNRDTEQDVDTETASCDVADVENESAECDKSCENIAAPDYRFICDVLSTLAGDS